MKIEFEKIEPVRVAYMRHVGPYEDLEQFWNKFMVWVFLGDFDVDNVTVIGVNHDNPHNTKSEQLRFDACVEVGKDFKPNDEVGVEQIEGGEYIKFTHMGPYDLLPDKLRKIYKQDIKKQCGRELQDKPCVMFYRNNPISTPPDELLTEIYLPIK